MMRRQHGASGEAGTTALRVVFVDHCARLSGGELALLRLIAALRGVDAHVVLAEDGPLVPRLSKVGATVTVMPLPERTRGLARHAVAGGRNSMIGLVDGVRYARALARHVTAIEADVVHTNSLKSMVYGSLAARLAGVPAVAHVRDRVAGDYLPRVAVAPLRGLIRSLPTVVVANSEATRATLGRRVVEVIQDPVPAAAPRSARRDGPFTVGIVGRLAPWKGQDLFLRAFARAFPTGDERAVIVGAALFGEDQYEVELRRLVTTLGLEGRVELRGFREDVIDELARLDVFVHASTIPEPFGLVVVEAMASGLPVIAPAAGGPAEVLTPWRDGLLYPMGDESALADQLVRLRRDPALRNALGKAAAASAQRFSPARIAEQVAGLYREISRPR